jgi:hypothetical protein
MVLLMHVFTINCVFAPHLNISLTMFIIFMSYFRLARRKSRNLDIPCRIFFGDQLKHMNKQGRELRLLRTRRKTLVNLFFLSFTIFVLHYTVIQKYFCYTSFPRKYVDGNGQWKFLVYCLAHFLFINLAVLFSFNRSLVFPSCRACPPSRARKKTQQQKQRKTTELHVGDYTGKK